jgi:N6-adenosine-specific RNA methylase IME4
MARPQRDVPATRHQRRRAPQLRADTDAIDIAPLPSTDGGWRTILADPAWRFTNRTGKVAPEHRRLDRYDTMETKDIAALPVADVVAADAHLYLWCPNALLPDGLQILESWGFRYVSNIVWAKRRKDGGPDGRGVGFYFRNVTELLLFGVRGKMRTLAPARRQVNMIETRKREHSRKPDEQYPLIEACSPGPYLEMFARYPQPGWVVWGNEAAADVTPRGKQHPMYRGSATKLGVERTVADINAALSDEALLSAYGAGATLAELAAHHGVSSPVIRRRILAVGGIIRSRGHRLA